MNAEATGGWRPFLLVTLMLVAGTMGATMASPLFPIYEAEWGISHGSVTVLYVTYMVGVLLALLFLAQLADRFGAIRVLRLGAGVLIAGLVMSALSRDVGALIPARVVIGIASGLITSSATMGLFRLEPAPGGRATVVASTTTMAGFSLGPLVSGIIAQFAPMPLVTPYLLIAVAVGALLVCLLLTRADTRPAGGGTLRLAPQVGLPDREGRGGFLVASFAVFSAYALFSLLASLAPSFLPLILPWHGPAISGGAVATVLMCSAGVQIPARRLSPRITLPLALLLLALGCVVLALAMRFQMPALFVLADLAIGGGHGLAFLSAMKVITLVARTERRSAILSSFLCIGYMGAIVPILAVGRLADIWGLSGAVITFCLAFLAICMGLLGLALRWSADSRAP